jgi:delta 1-pyrroline-5-carboxylate dehydrogenase
MGDRIDEQVAREWAKEARQERAADVKKAGPLFDDKTRAVVEFKISEATRLPAAEVKDIVDTIDHLAGEKGANAKEVVAHALEGHVSNPKFINNFAREMEGVVKTAIAARETRIDALHAAPAVPPAAPASAPRR